MTSTQGKVVNLDNLRVFKDEIEKELNVLANAVSESKYAVGIGSPLGAEIPPSSVKCEFVTFK